MDFKWNFILKYFIYWILDKKKFKLINIYLNELITYNLTNWLHLLPRTCHRTVPYPYRTLTWLTVRYCYIILSSNHSIKVCNCSWNWAFILEKSAGCKQNQFWNWMIDHCSQRKNLRLNYFNGMFSLYNWIECTKQMNQTQPQLFRVE